MLKQDIFSFLEAGTAAVVKHLTDLPAALPSSTLKRAQSHRAE